VELANALFEKKAAEIRKNEITGYGIYAFEKLLQMSLDDTTALLKQNYLPFNADESISCEATLIKAKANLTYG
jgi:hypothetical protein